MKSTIVAFGIWAGVASAHAHHARHPHGRFARRNETTSAVDALTTITVDVTSTHTITSCAPTITNCPAGINGTSPTAPIVVTEIVDLTTIVCPGSEASSVSSSVIDAHNSGLIPGSTSTLVDAATTPASGAYPVETGASSVVASVGTTDEVFTMTLGPEGSSTVRVTTLQSTYTEMVTVTAVPLPGGEDSGSGNGGDVTSSEGTTTTTLTSTGTRTVTITAQETTGNSPIGAEGGNSGSGSEGGAGEGECVPVTVTVTAAPSTVYITAAAIPTGASDNSPVPTESNGGDNSAGGDSGAGEDGEDECPPEDEEGDEDECSPDDEEDSGDVTAIATATVVPVPYPTGGNGTLPTFPTGTPERRDALY